MLNTKKFLITLMSAGFLCMAPQITFAEEDNSTVADTRNVPENIYTWVESTDRTNYFFNHKQINYEVSEDGIINLNILVAPTICMYDEIQIEDSVSKRRWKMQSLRGYDKLLGVRIT